MHARMVNSNKMGAVNAGGNFSVFQKSTIVRDCQHDDRVLIGGKDEN